jgi:hypothetical protein
MIVPAKFATASPVFLESPFQRAISLLWVARDAPMPIYGFLTMILPGAMSPAVFGLRSSRGLDAYLASRLCACLTLKPFFIPIATTLISLMQAFRPMAELIRPMAVGRRRIPSIWRLGILPSILQCVATCHRAWSAWIFPLLYRRYKN